MPRASYFRIRGSLSKVVGFRIAAASEYRVRLIIARTACIELFDYFITFRIFRLEPKYDQFVSNYYHRHSLRSVIRSNSSLNPAIGRPAGQSLGLGSKRATCFSSFARSLDRDFLDNITKFLSALLSIIQQTSLIFINDIIQISECINT